MCDIGGVSAEKEYIGPKRIQIEEKKWRCDSLDCIVDDNL